MIVIFVWKPCICHIDVGTHTGLGVYIYARFHWSTCLGTSSHYPISYYNDIGYNSSVAWNILHHAKCLLEHNSTMAISKGTWTNLIAAPSRAYKELPLWPEMLYSFGSMCLNFEWWFLFNLCLNFTDLFSSSNLKSTLLEAAWVCDQPETGSQSMSLSADFCFHTFRNLTVWPGRFLKHQPSLPSYNISEISHLKNVQIWLLHYFGEILCIQYFD